MKHIVLTFVFALVALVAVADGAAVVQLAGTTISLTTQSKYSSSSLSAIKQGTITFVPGSGTSKKLILDNVVMNAGNNDAIYVGIGLTIEVVGQCTLSSNYRALRLAGEADWCTITRRYNAYAKLMLTSTSNSALGINTSCKVSFRSIDVDADGAYGIRGTDGTSGESLYIGQYAHLRARGKTASVSNIQSITYGSGYGLFSHSSDSGGKTGSFNTSKHSVCDANGTVIGNSYVHFGKYYNLDVLGFPIHSGNYRYIHEAIDGLSNPAEYDPQTNTLYLNQTTITPPSGTSATTCISSVGSLNINVGNACQISAGSLSNPATAIACGGKLDLYGSAAGISSLRVSGYKQGIKVSGELVLRDVSADVSATSSEALKVATLSIPANQKGNLTAYAPSYSNGTIFAKSFNIPFDHYWEDSDGLFLFESGSDIVSTPGGKNATGTVKFLTGSKSFMLSVGETTVTSSNFYPVKGTGITGEVYYLPNENVLTLKNATLRNTKSSAALNNLALSSKLSVQVEGNCSMESASYCIYQSRHDLELKGVGSNPKLTMVSSNSSCIGTANARTTLMLRALTIEADGKANALKGGESDALVFDNVSASLKGSNGVINGFGTVDYYSCKVVDPVGATYNEDIPWQYTKDKQLVCSMSIAGNASILPVTVCGKEVVKLAGYDILGDGSVTYEEFNGVVPNLVIHKDIDYSGSYLIEYTGDDLLMITTDAPCTLSAKTNIIRSSKNILLNAPHRLKMSVTSNNSTAIYMRQGGVAWLNCADLVIDKCKWGIAGMQKNTAESLAFTGKATINATAAAIMDFKDISLINCEVLEPEGASVAAYGEGGGKAIVGTDGDPVAYLRLGDPNDADPADLNGDGSVNVGDVTTLVNMILGKTAMSAAADLNGDGSVNVGDVTTLVNMILGK